MSGPAPRYERWRADLSIREEEDEGTRWSNARERRERQNYHTLKHELTRAPDGSHPTEMQDDSNQGSSSSTSALSKATPKVPPLEVNNPLSLSDKNPWHSYFASLSMLDQIKVDVERAFPEDARLRPEFVQRQLVRILFVWSLMSENENVGYRQGMHEIAAICWLVRSEAKMQQTDQKSSLEEESKIEPDTFVLFQRIMERAKEWYEWRNLTKFPISRRCDAVQTLLTAIDRQLAVHLDYLGVEVQLFAIRWVRLIFTRELPLPMAMGLWDGLFSVDPSLELVDSICVAMLIRIRNQLLDSDYSSAMQSLLNYPTFAQQSSPLTLIKQAQEIKQSPGQTTLMNVIQENEETLNIPASSSSQRREQQNATPTHSHGTQPYNTFPTPPSLQHLTKGVYAQTLTAGFNRALYNVQKTVNAAYLAHAGNNDDNNGFPPSIDSVHRPNYPPKDASGELEELRRTNKAIGSTLVRVIDTLEKHWSEEVVGKKKDEEAGQATPMEIDFLLSLTTLKHSRDVLLGTTVDFDPSILDGPKMIKEDKQKEKENDQKAKDFGQRFKRTVEPELPNKVAGNKNGGESKPTPSPESKRTVASQNPVTLTLSPTVSPTPASQEGKITLRSPVSTTSQFITPLQQQRAPVKETIDDPLGVASR
ncbi:hypothetical protein CBS101457_005459 [Exobasidium rhododendri]|nr:hypothetical protein CBS101457_005459 [Exobasidium rhododendri]